MSVDEKDGKYPEEAGEIYGKEEDRTDHSPFMAIVCGDGNVLLDLLREWLENH